MSVATEPIPRLPAPDLASLRDLLDRAGLEAYLTPWTAWHHDRGQVGAGAYLIGLSARRDTFLDALLEAGYVCEDHDGCISVIFDKEDW